MDYSNDVWGKYLASRVLDNRKDLNTGITYYKAITSTRTTKEAIDWWIEELNKIV